MVSGSTEIIGTGEFREVVDKVICRFETVSFSKRVRRSSSSIPEDVRDSGVFKHNMSVPVFVKNPSELLDGLAKQQFLLPPLQTAQTSVAVDVTESSVEAPGELGGPF